MSDHTTGGGFVSDEFDDDEIEWDDELASNDEPVDDDDPDGLAPIEEMVGDSMDVVVPESDDERP